MTDPDVRPDSPESSPKSEAAPPTPRPSVPPVPPTPPGSTSALPPAASASPGSAPEKETEICSFHPSWKESFGRLLLGGLLAVAGLVLAVVGGVPWPGVTGGLLALAGAGTAGWAWLKTRTIRYRLTTERLFITTGLVGRRQNEMELFRIKDVSFSQTIGERLLGLGTIRVISTDDSAPDVTLTGIADAETIKDRLRDQYRAARRREGMRATEFISS